METVHDFTWNKGMKVHDFVEKLGKVGFQGVELDKASNVVVRMKKEGAKIFLTFTSNMVTSGLRGFFAQITKLKIPCCNNSWRDRRRYYESLWRKIHYRKIQFR